MFKYNTVGEGTLKADEPILNPYQGRWPFRTQFDVAFTFFRGLQSQNQHLRVGVRTPVVPQPKLKAGALDYGAPPTLIILFPGMPQIEMTFRHSDGRISSYPACLDIETILAAYKDPKLKPKKLHFVPGTVISAHGPSNASLWVLHLKGRRWFQVKGNNSVSSESLWCETKDEAISHYRKIVEEDNAWSDKYRKFREAVARAREQGPKAMAKFKKTPLFRQFENLF